MGISEVSRLDVLIAEDDPSLRQAVRGLLEGRGYVCAEAGTGREAVSLAQLRAPRCVLLDLGMPELDGLAVARLLRADPRTSGIHIHCLTGRSDPLARQQAREAGVEQFLLKPLDPAALLGALPSPVELGQPRVVAVPGLTLREAEGLLDWLEAQGWSGHDVAAEEQGVTVHVACPPGFDLVGDPARGFRIAPL